MMLKMSIDLPAQLRSLRRSIKKSRGTVHLLDMEKQNVTLGVGVREYAQSSKKKEFNRNAFLF